MTSLTDRQILYAVREALEEPAPEPAKDKRKAGGEAPAKNSSAQPIETARRPTT